MLIVSDGSSVFHFLKFNICSTNYRMGSCIALKQSFLFVYLFCFFMSNKWWEQMARLLLRGQRVAGLI